MWIDNFAEANQWSKHNFQKIDNYWFIVTYIHTTHIKSIDMNKYLKFTCITGTSYRILSKIFQKMSCIAWNSCIGLQTCSLSFATSPESLVKIHLLIKWQHWILSLFFSIFNVYKLSFYIMWCNSPIWLMTHVKNAWFVFSMKWYIKSKSILEIHSLLFLQP